MRKTLKATLIAGALLAGTSAEAATTYNLANDFSNINNPNGVWSFTKGSTLLTHTVISVSNTLNPALGNGLWSAGTNLNTDGAFVMKVTANGSATAPYTDGDFLAGDVLVHGTNPGFGSDAFINWTAPTAGVIDFTASIWYAHSPVTRVSDVSAFLNNVGMGTVTVSNGMTRANPANPLSAFGQTVAAGDVLSFRFAPRAGQQFGSLAGIDATVKFTANQVGGIPEPATWAMMISGFGLVGSAMRRRAKVQITYA